MTTKNTPGPWEFERVNNPINGTSYDVFVKETRTGWDHLYETDAYTVATIEGDRPQDAALIAAAPELLLIAQEVVKLLPALGYKGEVYKMTVAAIAKAGGN